MESVLVYIGFLLTLQERFPTDIQFNKTQWMIILQSNFPGMLSAISPTLMPSLNAVMRLSCISLPPCFKIREDTNPSFKFN